MKDFRGAMLLLAVLAALAVAVFALEGRGPSSAATPTPQGPSVFALREDDVVGVRIRDGQRVAAFARDGDKWIVAAPTTGPADEWRMASFITKVTKLQADRALTEPEDPKALGLDQPTMEIVVALASGEERLEIGAQNPRGTGHYARKAGSDQVYLIAASFVNDARSLASQPYPPTPAASPAATPAAPASPSPTPSS